GGHVLVAEICDIPEAFEVRALVFDVSVEPREPLDLCADECRELVVGDGPARLFQFGCRGVRYNRLVVKDARERSGCLVMTTQVNGSGAIVRKRSMLLLASQITGRCTRFRRKSYRPSGPPRGWRPPGFPWSIGSRLAHTRRNCASDRRRTD